MLRNLDNEFVSRYLNELALCDRYAKAIGDPTINGRAIKSHSMTYRIGLLISTKVQEAMHIISNTPDDNQAFKDIICREAFHKQLNLFNNEFSPIRLQLIAKETLRKFNQDYNISSFIHLVEWRRPKYATSIFLKPSIDDEAYLLQLLTQTTCINLYTPNRCNIIVSICLYI